MNTKKVLVTDMTEGSVPSLLVRYAIPFVLANLLQMVYNLVDTIIVGQFVGATGLTGVSVAGQITVMFTALTMGLVTGAQIMIAQYIGARQRENVNYTIGSMIVYGGGVAVILSIIGILTSRWGLTLIDTPAEAMQEALNYEIIIFIGLTFNCGYMAASSILRGMGDSKTPFVFIAIASVCNIVLDLLFVGVFNMQAAGAALATVISYVISFVFAARYIYLHREAFGIDFKLKFFKPRLDLCWTITKLGIPLALQWIIVSLSGLYVQSMVNAYGIYAAAAVAVGTKSGNLANTISMAMGQSCSTMAGQNIAARKIDRVKKTVRVALLINLSWMALCIVLLEIFTVPFIKIFNNDPQVIEIAVQYLRIVSLSFLPHAAYMVFNGIILGVGNSVLNMVNSLLEGVVLKITLSYLFANILGFGLIGVFIGTALSPLGACISGGFYYFSGMWTRRKLVASRSEAGPNAA
jgi:putative MATE family efflux protein